MKLNDIFTRAADLCGIGENYLNENDASELRLRALSAINSVLFDIKGLPAADNLSDEADITEADADALVYGTAMFLSLAYGDTDRSALFSKIYSDRRTALKSTVSKISDALPKTEAAL